MSLGGPGWFSDILECKFVFDDSCYTLIKDDHAKAVSGADKKLKAFDGRGAISGKLVVVPPEGRDITHNGIEIILTSNADGAAPLSNQS